MLSICAFSLFLLLNCTSLCVKKTKRKPWNDSVIVLMLIECFALLLTILNLIYSEEIDLNLAVLSLTLCTKTAIMLKNRSNVSHEKCSIILILSFDFVVMLYKMAFEVQKVDFWLCCLRSITNGAVILIILPKLIKDANFEEEKTDEKFKYSHENVNLLSKWTFSWMLPLLWSGYKNPIDVEILEKVTELEKSKTQGWEWK